MIDIYVLNKDLVRVGIIDAYKSLIWASRYNEVGDCELYVPATTKAFNLLKKGYYLSRDDDDMVCRIEKIELDTDVENGDYLIVTGYDVKKIVYQRVIWSQTNVDGKVEDYIRNIVYKSLVAPALYGRAITNTQGRNIFFLGDKANFKEVTTQQVTYENVGEKTEDLCKQYEWGFKVIVDISVNNFYFLLYKGTDRSDSVKFSHEFENLVATKYVEDSSHLANVALVAGEGEGSQRSRNVSGFASGLDRYEIYVDARDISKTITYEELTNMYPLAAAGGQGYIDGTYYKMGYINIPIVDSDQLTQLKLNYPNGEEIYISGVQYYRTYDPIIADLKSTSPASGDEVILRPLIYEIYLLNRGYEKLSEYGTTVSFEGTVNPNITFVYKQDYFLGDLVTVENEYGISKKARIIEVVEIDDENGHNVEPKFEYMNNGNTHVQYLTTENHNILTTEANDYLEIERGI